MKGADVIVELMLMAVYFIFIAIVIEMATTFLCLTGLSREVSRYQAISMLTNTGFTTDEAKLILEHPIRRKISAFLILFGAFSLAVVISILSTYLSDDLKIPEMAALVVLFSVFLLLLKTKRVTNVLKKKFSSEMKDHYDPEELPINEVLYVNEDDYFTDIPIQEGSSYIGKKLADMFSENEDVHLLFIKRGEEAIRKNLDEEHVQEGDLFFVYGSKKEMVRKFHHELDYKEQHKHHY